MRTIYPPSPIRALIPGLLLAAAGCASVPAGRSAVDSVNIVSSGTIDESDVADRLATAASPRFLGLPPGFVYDYEIFDASKLQRDLARVERYYRGRGFLGAHARAARVIRTGKGHVRVEIVVYEGPSAVDRQLRVEGLEGLPAAIAAAVRNAAADALPASTRFDEDAYKKAQAAVVRSLTDRGYAYATVQADAQADVLAHAVDYTFTLSPGPPAVFGPIAIVGLDPDGDGPAPQEIEEAPLRRAMKLEPGAVYSTAAIDSATQALLDLEVMSAVQIVPTLSNPPTGVVPLTVKVEPAKLRALRLGGGFEFDDIKTELHALVGWEDHDFLGDLRDLSIDFKPGFVVYPLRADNVTTNGHLVPIDMLPEAKLRLQLRQSGVFEARTTLFVQPEVNVSPLLVSTNPPPNSPVVGYVEPKGAVGVNRRFGEHFLVTLAHNVQAEKPFSYLRSQPIDPALPTVVLSFPQLITTFDFRDSTVHPHAGFYATNNLQIAGVGGTATDVSIQPEVRGYLPIGKRVTFAARASLGILFAQNYGDFERRCLTPTPPSDCSGVGKGVQDRDIEIVYFRGFFSGGPNSNRGFPLRGIAPHGYVPFLNPATASTQERLGCDPAITPDANRNPLCRTPIGGFTQWEASAEVRFTVSGPFGAAVFCDAADVSAERLDFRPDHPHLACGIGGRYDTPVGPVRLDIGYRIQPLQVLGYASESQASAKDPTEGTQPTIFGIPVAVSFGIGESF
jgi:outer membrane protein insertion porin family/translocation and assembly module TamA